MNHEHDTDDMAAHEEISALLPWYFNGTLGEYDRQRIDSHLRGCAHCRDVMLQERRLYEAMAAESGVEYMPAASLKRLQARLDGLDAAAASAAVAAESPRGRRAIRRAMPWQRWAAASVAAMIVALGVVTADQWMRLRERDMPSNYHTVTTSVPRAPDEVIRAVFSPTVTLVDLQAILEEAQLRIISGPTEAGVYSLATNSNRPVSSSLAQLRRHAAVRFAESTQLDMRPDNSRGSGKSP